MVVEQAAAVLGARSELAQASKQMARYGVVGAMALGLSIGQLRRLAAGPPDSDDMGHLVRDRDCTPPGL